MASVNVYRYDFYDPVLKHDRRSVDYATGDAITAEEDGRPLEGAQVKLADDGQTHRVAVALPPRRAAAGVSRLEPVLTESR